MGVRRLCALFSLLSAVGLAEEESYLALQESKMKLHPALVRGFDAVTERKVLQYFGPATRSGELVLRGKSMLCVGARGGGEIRAFGSLGAFAVGIDLFPTNAEYVLKGDAHNLRQFGNGTVDVVYTNILDHIPRLAQFISEVWRVLKPHGLLISDVFFQTMAQDKWAVRETGTPAFFAEYGGLLRRAGFAELRRDERQTKQRRITHLFHQLNAKGKN